MCCRFGPSSVWLPKGISIGSTPEKRGAKSAISRSFLKLVALHVNMEQVGAHGEMSVAQIKATLTTATFDTVHEGKFNAEYAWEQVRRIHADIFVPTGIVQAGEIRWQWVTFERVNSFMTTTRGVCSSSILLLLLLLLLLLFLLLLPH